VAAAAAAIRRVVCEAQDRVARPRVLAAYVEIGLAVDDVGAAAAPPTSCRTSPPTSTRRC
jgi:hypothetical protein